MDVDASDVFRLAADLGKTPARVVAAASTVIKTAAADIEQGMRKDFTGHRYAPHIPRAVNSTVRGLTAEIGVDKRGPQGGLGNILAYGTRNNAPVVNHAAALQFATPGLITALTDAAEEAIP